MRRHRLALAAAALVLGPSAAASSWPCGRRAARERPRRAQQRFNDVRELANAFLNEFHDSIKQLPGSTRRALLVRKGLAYLTASREATGDASLQRDLADGYQRLGDLQGSPGEGSAMLGDMAGARKSLRQCVALREQLVRSREARPQDRVDLAGAYSRLGNVLTLDGHARAAIVYADRAVTLFEAAGSPGDLKTAYRLANAQIGLGSALQTANESPRALAAFERGLEGHRAVCAATPSDDLACRSVFVGCYKIGNLESERGHHDRAAAAYREAISISSEFHRRDPGNGMYQRDLAFTSGGLGLTLLARGDVVGAQEYFHAQSNLLRSLAEADPDNPNPRIWLGESIRYLGKALLADGKISEGRARLLEAAEILETIVVRNPGDVSAESSSPSPT
jgi:non-specific serine/threonine protein kinase/serine/threonine-protein kinase